MSITVKSIDEQKAKQEVKKCPKIVRDYVRALENALEMSKNTNRKAIAKLKQLSK